MRVPQMPPDRNALLDSVMHEGADRLRLIFQTSGMVDHKGRYLHWDELRRKKSPSGLTPEELWVGTSMAREQAMQKLPLLDKMDAPFRFCEPQLVRATLRDLDMNAGGALGSDRSSVGPTGDDERVRDPSRSHRKHRARRRSTTTTP